MSRYFSDLETRSDADRAAAIAKELPEQIRLAQALPAYATTLADVSADAIKSVDDLAALPVTRKSALVEAQKQNAPLGGFTGPITGFAHVFQSPGPIYEPGNTSHDW